MKEEITAAMKTYLLPADFAERQADKQVSPQELYTELKISKQTFRIAVDKIALENFVSELSNENDKLAGVGVH